MEGAEQSWHGSEGKAAHLLESADQSWYKKDGRSAQVFVETVDQSWHRRRAKGNHNRFRVHECTYCNYTTFFTTNLKNHMRTHTGEKPYSCQQCPYHAVTKQRLERHMQIHIRSKNWHAHSSMDPQEMMKSHIVISLRKTGMRSAFCARCGIWCLAVLCVKKYLCIVSNKHYSTQNKENGNIVSFTEFLHCIHPLPQYFFQP